MVIFLSTLTLSNYGGRYGCVRWVGGGCQGEKWVSGGHRRGTHYQPFLVV